MRLFQSPSLALGTFLVPRIVLGGRGYLHGEGQTETTEKM